jgi:hypothetical protein
MADIESLRQAVQSRAPFSTWLGVVLLFCLFGVIVLAVVGPVPRGDNYEQTRAKAREEKLKTLRDENAKALTTYGWVDKNKKIVRLPIARAMEVTVAELASKKPAPAYPIATPEPPAAPAGTPAPAASPAASPQPTGGPKPNAVAGPGSEAHNQPAAAVNPAPAPPGTQPGASGSPAGSPLPAPSRRPTSAPSLSSPGKKS